MAKEKQEQPQIKKDKTHQVKTLISEIRWSLEILEGDLSNKEMLKEARTKAKELNELIKTFHKEQTTEDNEKKYQLIFESSNDAIMTLEPPNWNFTTGNPATIKMFLTKNEEDFISRGPWEYSPEYQSDGQSSKVKAKEMIMKAVKKGSNFFEWTHKRLTGEKFAATVSLVRIELGGQKILQATVKDVSQQKKAEEQLKEKVNELENINKIMIGREMKMVELKREIIKLKGRLNENK